MDVDDFWNLIELSSCETNSRKARVTWLEDELSRRPVEEIIDFHAWWNTTKNRGRTVDVYAAYWFVFGSGAPDGFEHFVSWLVSLGREPFEAVANCPDRLVELPQVQRMLEREPNQREERPEFELLAYVAHRAYEQVTGQDPDELDKAPGGVPRGEEWDFRDERELARRMPRIAHHLGLA